MLFEELLFQPLQRIELLDPWEGLGDQCGQVGKCLLAGGFVLHFDSLALVCTSPMRFLQCQQGTFIDGLDPIQLGYRIMLADVQDIDLVIPRCQNRYVMRLSTWFGSGMRDAVPPVLLLTGLEQAGEYFCVTLNILGQGCYSLTYRPDLDGSIQLAPQGQASKVSHVTVSSPNATLGYLHPSSAYPFVIDGKYWPSAALNSWPLEARKQSALDPTGQRYRYQLRTALLARFRQHDGLRRRLLVLQCKVTVLGVPAGLIEDLATQLRRESYY